MTTETQPNYHHYINQHYEEVLNDSREERDMEREYKNAVENKHRISWLEGRWKFYALLFGLLGIFRYFGNVVGILVALGGSLWILGHFLFIYLSLIHNQLMFVADRLGPDRPGERNIEEINNPFEDTKAFLYIWLESRHWLEFHDANAPQLQYVMADMLEQKLRRYGFSEDEIYKSKEDLREARQTLKDKEKNKVKQAKGTK